MKGLYVTLFVLFGVLSAEAQQLNLQLKAYGGVHIGRYNYKRDTLERDDFVGYQGGFAFRVSKGDVFLEPGFNFLRSHVLINDQDKEEFMALGFTDPVLRYNSFEFPVVIGYKFISTPLFKWYVDGGLGMSVSIKSQLLDGDEQVLKLKAKQLGFVNPRFKMILGSGMDIAFFNIDLNYHLGLNNTATDPYRVQSHYLELNFGFLF